jgi:hypothetical protein
MLLSSFVQTEILKYYLPEVKENDAKHERQGRVPDHSVTVMIV